MEQEQPPAQVDIRTFPGLNLEADPHDLQAGQAQEQTNCTSEDAGALKSRLGYRVVTFDA